MKQRAIIYARQSSGSDDYSESVEVQISNCRKLADQREIEVVDIISDLNISGKTYPAGWQELAASDRAFQLWAKNNSSGRLFRRGLGRLFSRLGEINCIIVDDITRLYRPLSRSYLENAVNQSLIEHDVKILQVKGGTLDLAMFDQQLITMLKNQINDEQIAKQRQRSIEVFNRLRDSGVMPTGITAFALNYDRASKRYSIDEEKGSIVKFIFRELLAQNSYCNIIRSINERWKHFFNGCFWEKNLYEIARKPIYAGHQYNTAGELIPNLQGNALISLEDFLSVQELMHNKRLKYAFCKHDATCYPAHWLPLSGLLYCGNCGSRLVVAIEKGKISYRCRKGALLGNDLCRSSRIAMYCSKPHITGVVDAIQAALGYALLARLQAGTPRHCIADLIDAYRQNKFTAGEYESLLKESVNRIDVHADFINVYTQNETLFLPRKIVLRQKGFSQNILTRLRKQLLYTMEFAENLPQIL